MAKWSSIAAFRGEFQLLDPENQPVLDLTAAATPGLAQDLWPTM
jgi:hypothetical protein